MSTLVVKTEALLKFCFDCPNLAYEASYSTFNPKDPPRPLEPYHVCYCNAAETDGETEIGRIKSVFSFNKNNWGPDWENFAISPIDKVWDVPGKCTYLLELTLEEESCHS